MVLYFTYTQYVDFMLFSFCDVYLKIFFTNYLCKASVLRKLGGEKTMFGRKKKAEAKRNVETSNEQTKSVKSCSNSSTKNVKNCK